MSEIVKKQMYLTSELNRAVKELADETGRTESAVIREALVDYVAVTRGIRDPMDDIIGMVDATDVPTDGSINHDRYLYDDRNG
ncbi:MAG TPA: CopG family transcriptional regulator [Chloroflexota bacterium]|jgi:predicted DNA-binding protein|nr:CopG family transcriptional regulator [Chloroflexota bacterium]